MFTVPPHILNEDSSRDMDVEEGDDVRLTCKATGVPVPNITWYRRSLLETDGKECKYRSATDDVTIVYLFTYMKIKKLKFFII